MIVMYCLDSVRRRLRQVEQPAGQSAGGQRQRVRDARDEPTGTSQDVSAQLVHGVQLVYGRAFVFGENDVARRERWTGVRDWSRRRSPLPGQRVRGVPIGRHRSRKFRHCVQEANDRVEVHHVLQKCAGVKCHRFIEGFAFVNYAQSTRTVKKIFF